jgi:ABC-type branched-subunit amino acid transport system ATPase component
MKSSFVSAQLYNGIPGPPSEHGGMPAERVALGIRGLEKRFGGIQGVAGVDLVFDAPGLVGIIGANGAGKTTLLNLVTGFLLPDHGSVTWCDKNMSNLRPSRRQRLGLGRTFQQHRVVPDWSVIENARIGCLRRHGLTAAAASARIERTLRMLGIPDETWATPIAAVPSPVQKLTEIVRVLAPRPAVVFADEPFAGLDSHQLDLLCAVLREEAETSAVVIVDHRLETLMSLVDRVVVMAEGRIIFDGDPQLAFDDAIVQASYLGGEALAETSGRHRA